MDMPLAAIPLMEYDVPDHDSRFLMQVISEEYVTMDDALCSYSCLSREILLFHSWYFIKHAGYCCLIRSA